MFMGVQQVYLWTDPLKSSLQNLSIIHDLREKTQLWNLLIYSHINSQMEDLWSAHNHEKVNDIEFKQYKRTCTYPLHKRLKIIVSSASCNGTKYMYCDHNYVSLPLLPFTCFALCLDLKKMWKIFLDANNWRKDLSKSLQLLIFFMTEGLWTKEV